MQFPLRASEDTSVFSMQSTPGAASVETANAVSPKQDSQDEDVWNVWPYCWVIDGYHSAQNRFHSFHEKLIAWKLARHNRREVEQFRARFWQNWNRRDGESEVEMRLL